jgi:hypothetical protein
VLLTAGTLAVGVVLAAIVLLSLLPQSAREGRGSLIPLAFGLVVMVLVVVTVLNAGRAARALAPEMLADEADAAAGLGAGDLRGALEFDVGSDGRSLDLVQLHRRRVEGSLSGVPIGGLLPRTGAAWRSRLRTAAAVSVLAALALGASAVVRPAPTLSAALALGAPWKTAFPDPLPPLELRLETRVTRGEVATVGITAHGRFEVDLVVRPAGEPPVRRSIAVPQSGESTARVGPISVPTRVWVEDAASGSSDTILVRPLEPLLVQDIQVRVEYPAYLGRPSETHRGQIPPLVTPEGTVLTVSGEANLNLTLGELVRTPPDIGEFPVEEGPALPLTLDGPRFGVTLTPVRSGTWNWRLRAVDEIGDAILPDPIRVVLVPDLRPGIQLLFPPPDTLLGSDRVMPIVVDVEDDIGLRAVALRSWRSGLGSEAGERRETLAPGPDGARRAVFRHLIDRSDEQLLPGDTVFYRFEAFDGHPSRGPAISDTFLLRVPTFTEIRDARADETRGLSDSAEELEDAMDRLAEAAADAARRVDAGEEAETGFEATEEARAVLDAAAEAAEELAALEDEMANLADDASESSVNDEALAEQLEMLAERYRELMESGFSDQIEQLAEALQDLDSESVRQALDELSEDSEWLREQLERTLGMLDQAALDQEMKSAQANAEDLAAEQRELADGESTPEEFVEEQERLAEDAEDLAAALDELERRLEETGQQAAADSAAAAGERTQEAMQRMEEAAAQGQQAGEQQAGEQSQSSDAASEAAEAMEQAAEALGAAQQSMEQAGREDAAETLGRARSEALSLAAEEGRLAEATRGEDAQDPETWRARQGAIRQGLENLLDRLAEAGNEAALMDQETGAAAGEAIERMDGLLERLAQDGARRLPSRAEAEGIQESLNGLAMQLLAGEQAARAAQQQSQGQEAGEQMQSLAQQQQAITQETSSLLMPGPKPSGEERTEEVARQQQQIAEELQDMDDSEGDLLGSPEELAREAEELARQLEESGPTQETLDRQRRLFERMLDAGRSLEEEDEEPDPNRRESTTGQAVPRGAPEIDIDALRGRRYPLPSEDLLRDLPIFYRPLIFDYFDRLNRSGSTARPAPAETRPPPPPASGERRDG